MKLLMMKTIVMEGAARFMEMYPKKVYPSKSSHSGTRRLGQMRDKLAAMDLDNMCKELGPRLMRDAVEKLIGNNTWTRIECDECGDDIVVGMQVGNEVVQGMPVVEATANLCQTCVNKAAISLQKAVITA